jgi:hypothetical protein
MEMLLKHRELGYGDGGKKLERAVYQLQAFLLKC